MSMNEIKAEIKKLGELSKRCSTVEMEYRAVDRLPQAMLAFGISAELSAAMNDCLHGKDGAVKRAENARKAAELVLRALDVIDDDLHDD